MKPPVRSNNIHSVLPLLIFFICILLSSCSENGLTSSYDEDPQGLKDSIVSGSITNLIDNYSLQRGCTAANAWVEEHADNLPASFASISEYPEEYRKAIFIELSTEQKANVWIERLLEVMNNITLNSKQHSLLGEIIKNLSPSVFDKNVNSDVINDKKLKSVFGETLAANIFSSLSPVQDLNERKTRSFVYEMNKIVLNSNEVIANSILPDCTCSSTSDYCGITWECAKGRPFACWDSNTGCGTFWLYGCDGLCARLNGGCTNGATICVQ